MIALRLGWRLLRRDLAAGEVRVLLAALVLAVCAVGSVGGLTDRVARALADEANRLLGADAVLAADQPIGDAARDSARALDLAVTESWRFPSMLQAGERTRLAELHALGPHYPLRGQYRIVDGSGEHGVQGPPAAGTLWLTRAGADALGVQPGDDIVVGERPLRLAALVLDDPEAGFEVFNIAPPAFLNLDDVPSTGLVQVGSRVDYRLLVAGERDAVKRWLRARHDALGRGQRIEAGVEGRPQLRVALERAGRFLVLAALVAVVLAGIAVALAARRHAEHHLDGCAVMRCIGAPQQLVLAIHVGELAWLGLFGIAGGLLAALALQLAVGDLLAARMGIALPAPALAPLGYAAGTGALVLAAFALPPLLSLRRVPAMRVLRRDLGRIAPGALLTGGAGIAGLLALLWWQAGSPTLAGVLLGGLALTLAALAGLAGLMVVVVRWLRPRLRGPWRYGLANVGRRAGGSIVQVSALGLGLMAVLLLTLVRTDLVTRWQQMLPADTPNRFLVGVQPDQREPVRRLLRDAGIDGVELFPMVRARLVSVNGQPVTGADYADERARHLAEREFNLSTADTLRERDNRIVAGHWWASDSAGELSVEQDFAARLGWQLGDRIGFDVAGTPVEGRITSLRKVDWQSFRPNFFVLVSPGLLDAMPTSHIGAIFVPPASSGVTARLVQRFPNVTVVDIGAVLDQVRRTADQVAQAVEYVFWFTLAAGLLVLLAAISATRDERLHEGGVMRVLGASRRQLRLAQLSEFAVLGVLAGLTAAVAAAIVSGLIARRVFELPWQPDWRLALVGGGIGDRTFSINDA